MTHAQMMAEYYAARESQERACEEYSLGYETEAAEFWAFNERLTFKSFLIGRKGENDVDRHI